MLAAAAVPALAIGHLTHRRRWVWVRIGLQVAVFAATFVWLLPHLALQADGLGWRDVVDHSYPVRSLLLMGALYFFVQKTKTGTAIRAAAIDQGAAKLMGINVNRVISIVFLIGPALGGAAGVMVGMYYGQVNFTMGWMYGLKAFIAAILGGIGNIPGAMLGGLLLGVIEAMGAAYLSIAWKDAIAFVVLILILIVRPTGLLGERVAEKV